MKRYRSNGKDWLIAMKGVNLDSCVLWPFATNSAGYGVFKSQGECRLAHRFMCSLVHGDPLHSSAIVLHSCNNGHIGCVNPRHLRWGNRAQNYEDSAAIHTAAFGEKHGNAKLTDAHAVAIRSAPTMTAAIAAAEGRVGEIQVLKIRMGRAWNRIAE